MPAQSPTLRRSATTSLSGPLFATHARAWLLVATLTALLIGTGALIGGTAMYAFALVGTAFNLGGYWFSDKIALHSSRARPLPRHRAPLLHGMVESLAERAGVPTPRLYLIPSQQPNAFATGRNPRHASVAVTEGLLTHLSPEELRGVLAHEMAHIKNRDILVSTIAATIAGAISAIANFLQFSWLFGGEDEDSPTAWLAQLAMVVLGPLAAMLLQLAVSRQREYLADATGAQLLGDGRPLADALLRIERAARVVPMQINPAHASLYAINPLPRAGLTALFMTHPPTTERIRRLRALTAVGARRARTALAV
jgi:heat shock protein HtpX